MVGELREAPKTNRQGTIVAVKWAPRVALALQGLASIAAAEGQHERALQLFGSADAFRAAQQPVHFGPGLALHRVLPNRWLALASSALGESLAAEALAARSLSIDQAVEYALARDQVRADEFPDANVRILKGPGVSHPRRLARRVSARTRPRLAWGHYLMHLGHAGGIVHGLQIQQNSLTASRGGHGKMA